MALSVKLIAKYLLAWQQATSLPIASHHLVFARVIEAAVRKQDEALIQQLVEALEQLVACHEEPGCPAVTIGKEAITAGRARLGSKP